MKEGEAVEYSELLDEIKKEIQQEINEEYIPFTGGYTNRTLSADTVLSIIDKYRDKVEGR